MKKNINLFTGVHTTPVGIKKGDIVIDADGRYCVFDGGVLRLINLEYFQKIQDEVIETSLKQAQTQNRGQVE